MIDQTANTLEDLKITASETSSPDDFDFFIGKWRVHNRRLDRRLANCDDWTEFESASECRKILNGFGNADFFKATLDGRPFEGRTFRIFNRETRLWSIYWADSARLVLDVAQVGSFTNRVGEFPARDVFEGRPVIVLYKWDATDPEKPVWSQAFSEDEGRTWEWNWFMTFTRDED